MYLLVCDDQLIGTRQVIDQEARGQVTVESVESFIAQNIEELSDFAIDNVKDGLRSLLTTYNERVNQVETDKSLMIDIPPNLLD